MPGGSVSGRCWTEVEDGLHMGRMDLQAQCEGYILYHSGSTIVSSSCLARVGNYRGIDTKHMPMRKDIRLADTIMLLVRYRFVTETCCWSCSALSIPGIVLLAVSNHPLTSTTFCPSRQTS